MLAVVLLTVFAARPELSTEAERSDWRKTGRYAEVLRLCADFPKAFPGQVRCEVFGQTPEGRKMVALIAGRKPKPVVYLQGGIHAGEIDGKDAGFKLLRDVLAGRVSPGLLDK